MTKEKIKTKVNKKTQTKRAVFVVAKKAKKKIGLKQQLVSKSKDIIKTKVKKSELKQQLADQKMVNITKIAVAEKKSSKTIISSKKKQIILDKKEIERREQAEIRKEAELFLQKKAELKKKQAMAKKKQIQKTLTLKASRRKIEVLKISRNFSQNIFSKFKTKCPSFLHGMLHGKQENKKIREKKQLRIYARSLSDFLENHDVKRESYGKAYFYRKNASLAVSFFGKITQKIYSLTRRLTWTGAALVILSFVIYGAMPKVLSAPFSVSVDTRAQWEAGTHENTSTLSANDSIQLASQGSWSARTWAVPPDTISAGSSSIFIGNDLYVMRGLSDKAFWKYDSVGNEWTELKDMPFPSYHGGDMVADSANGLIYVIFGGYSKKFYSYNVASNAWTELPDLLDTTWTGSSIGFDGTNPYVIRGNASTDFWKYNVSLGEWQSLAPVSATISAGANLVYGYDGNFYTPRGLNTLTFYRYNIATNTWSARANITTGQLFNGNQKGAYANGYIYYPRAAGTNGFLRFDIAGNSWTVLNVAPAVATDCSIAFNANDNLLYMLRGAGTYDLWKFDPALGVTGDWVGPQQVMNNTVTMGTGSDLLWNNISGAGSYVYAVRGGTAGFYRYANATNTWSTLTSLPAVPTTDTTGTLIGDYIYYPLGNNTTTFYRYTISLGTWAAMTVLPGTVSGGSAAYNASDGKVYVLRGNGTSNFYSSPNVSTLAWTTLASTVVDGVTYNAFEGAKLVSDGTNLFATIGDGETAFLKYDTVAASWSKMSPTPFVQYFGTSLTHANGKIYALAGFYKDETWEYSISTNTWRMLPTNQKYLYGRGPYNGANIEYVGGNSFMALTGQSTTDMWSFTAGVNNFVGTGSYVSETLDVSQATNWTSFIANDTIPANTSILYETRTSTDANAWSAWGAVSGTTINSPAQRYIQVKITLSTSDGVSTPTVSDYSITYNNSDTPPINPTAVNAFSQNTGGVTLTSGQSYLHEHPSFNFIGASSPEAGIAGYYVYFGTNATADPVTEGSFQESASYEVNTALDAATYYLRIKTEDNNGNVSGSTYAGFTYVYNGVAPALTETKTTQSDFSAGTLSDVSAVDVPDSLRLSSVGTNGFWNQSRMTNALGTMYYGSDSVQVNYAGNDYIFALRGGNTTGFYRYALATDTWTSMKVTPAIVGYGGAIEAGPNGFLYATQGGNLSTFWKYEIATDTWTAVSSAPKNFYIGGSISFDGSRYIYGLPGSDDAFYRYDTQTDSWTVRSNAQFGNPNTLDGQLVNYDSDSVYDGRNNVYVTQGNYYPYFAKYSIADDAAHGEVANTWTILASAPTGIYTGGSLAYDSVTNSVYSTRGNWKNNFYRYDVSANAWSQLPDTPVGFDQGASQVVYNGYIYALRGANTVNFYRYNIAESSWEIPTKGLFGPSIPGGTTYFPFTSGTYSVSDGSKNLYMIRGNYDNVFMKYDTETGAATEMAKLPVGAWDGSSLVYVGDQNEIYYSPGAIRTTRVNGKGNYFYKYDILTNSWSELTTDQTPLPVGAGSSMTYDGSRYVYLTRGATTTTWWRYDLDASAGSRWSTALPAGVGNTVIGGKMIHSGNYIYAVRGGTNAIYRYDPVATTWAVMPVMPAVISTGGGIVDGKDGYLYVTRGTNTSDNYRYRISDGLAGAWSLVTAIPAQVQTGGFQEHVSNRNWVIAGNGTNSYPDGLYSYVVSSQTNGTGFKKMGTYTSEALDLISVYKWANLSVDMTKPKNTFVSFETRTSSDGVNWSTWSTVSNEKVFGNKHVFNINSNPDKMIQVRSILSSADQIFSPVVNDFTVSYYQDIAVPTNPSAVSAYAANTKITSINNNTWYNHAAPYFEWPAIDQIGGASDGIGGSGIAGYYVYFGVDPNGEPLDFQTANSFQAGSLAVGQTYYLRILAKDNAGMIPPSAFTAFTYKFDNLSPINPSDISVTPTGYTATDNFAFLWTPDASDSFSGIAKLQYRTDGDVADVWTDIVDVNQVSLTIPNAQHIVGAYQSGKNKFFVRVVDGAGNVSAPLMQEYYFSSSAPTPPENLVATPETASENKFGFSWDKPLSFAGGDETKLVYHYSINMLPTENNTVATSFKAVSAGPFATQKGENQFFVVAEDESGNIDYNQYASVKFYANTTNPPIPGKVQIFDTSDRENSKYSIAVKWTRPEGIDSANFDGFVIYRSEDDVTFTEVAKTSGSAYVDSGEMLLPSGDTTLESKLYYYYVKTKDKTSNYSAASSTVSIIPTGKYTQAPKLVGTPSFQTQAFQTTFTWATDRVASSFVEYGKAISLGQTTGQVDSMTQHEVLVKGLDAGTKYFYQVKYIDPDGNIGTSEIDTFTTLPPPLISDVLVSEVQLYTGVVNWKTNVSATCTLDYGAYTIEGTGANSDHSQKIDKLMPANDYRVRIKCIDGDLNIFSSDEYAFRTPEEPVVSDVVIENKENVDLPTVIIRYKTNVPTKTTIYYKSASSANFLTYNNDELLLEHEAEITELEPAIEYVLNVTGFDQSNIQARPFEQRITTKTDSRPPQIVLNRSMGRVSGRGNNAQSNVYIKVETDEETRINVFYAKGIVTKSFEQITTDSIFDRHHIVTIPAESGQVYSYQFEALDDAGNKTLSDPVTVPVEQAKANATEVITKTFANRFGWLSRLGGN